MQIRKTIELLMSDTQIHRKTNSPFSFSTYSSQFKCREIWIFPFSNRIWIYIFSFETNLRQFRITKRVQNGMVWCMIAMLNDLECVLKTNIDDDLWFISAIRKSENSIFNRNKFKTIVLHTYIHTVRYMLKGWLGRMDVHSHL